MTHWMCTCCGYHLQTAEPPNKCPSCEQICVFNNVTCYLPSCEGQIDPVLMGNTLKALKGVREPAEKPKPAIPSSEDVYLVSILKGLDAEQSQKFKSLGNIENYETNAVICTQGSDARKFYLVEKGQVAATTQLATGLRFPISTISAGYAFGWSALVPPYLYTSTATAIFRTQVIALEREALLSMMQDNPSLGLMIMQNIAGTIASRMRTLELILSGLLKKS